MNFRSKTFSQVVTFAFGFVVAWSFFYAKSYYFHGKYPSNDRRKVAVFFGDSITQQAFNPSNEGFVAHFANWWARKVDVINRGFSGYNTQWGLDLLGDILVHNRPDLLVIFFGANDAIDESIVQYVPLVDYRKNLVKMIELTNKQAPTADIILVTPPPVWEADLEVWNRKKGKRLLRDRTNDRTKSYAEICLSVGKDLKVSTVDAWDGLDGISNQRSMFLGDGLHLNKRGNERLFHLIQAKINADLPWWNEAVIPMNQPHWSQVKAV